MLLMYENSYRRLSIKNSDETMKTSKSGSTANVKNSKTRNTDFIVISDMILRRFISK